MGEDDQKKIIKGFRIPYPEFGITPEVIIKGDVVKVSGTEGKPFIVVNEKDKRTLSEKLQDELEPIITAPMMDKE